MWSVLVKSCGSRLCFVGYVWLQEGGRELSRVVGVQAIALIIGSDGWRICRPRLLDGPLHFNTGVQQWPTLIGCGEREREDGRVQSTAIRRHWIF